MMLSTANTARARGIKAGLCVDISKVIRGRQVGLLYSLSNRPAVAHEEQYDSESDQFQAWKHYAEHVKSIGYSYISLELLS
jgi:hypothetical protein